MVEFKDVGIDFIQTQLTNTTWLEDSSDIYYAFSILL